MKGSIQRVDASPKDEAIAIHLLRALTTSAREGRRTDTAELARDIGVRRTDARRVLTLLDRQGFVDVLTMRPTLAGFALGASIVLDRLPALRAPRELAIVRAA